MPLPDMTPEAFDQFTSYLETAGRGSSTIYQYTRLIRRLYEAKPEINSYQDVVQFKKTLPMSTSALFEATWRAFVAFQATLGVELPAKAKAHKETASFAPPSVLDEALYRIVGAGGVLHRGASSVPKVWVKWLTSVTWSYLFRSNDGRLGFDFLQRWFIPTAAEWCAITDLTRELLNRPVYFTDVLVPMDEKAVRSTLRKIDHYLHGHPQPGFGVTRYIGKPQTLPPLAFPPDRLMVTTFPPTLEEVMAGRIEDQTSANVIAESEAALRESLERMRAEAQLKLPPEPDPLA